jgi:hypothetical protein
MVNKILVKISDNYVVVVELWVVVQVYLLKLSSVLVGLCAKAFVSRAFS